MSRDRRAWTLILSGILTAGLQLVPLQASADAGALTASADSAAIKEDASPNTIVGNVLANDTSADGFSLVVTNAGTFTLSHGALVINADGSYRYTLNNSDPAVNALDDGGTLTDTFTYSISDGHGGTASTTLTITIKGTTDAPAPGAPIVVDDSYQAIGGGLLTVTKPGVLGNDHDPDGDPLTAQVVAGPATGSLTMNTDGSFTYTPGDDASGVVTFTYRASDAQSSGVATVRITVTAGCGGVAATTTGTPGDDILNGTVGADVIAGLGGNDVIHGLSSSDRICGGSGSDTITGDTADDLIDGGAGDDVINGGAGNDRIYGAAGDDTVTDDAGNDILDGGDGNDTVSAGAGNDTVVGGLGNDTLAGGVGNDSLDGSAGNDTLQGDVGLDRCDGAAGTDTAASCETVTGVP